MILSYLKLVGSSSAKDIFNQCMGAYLKEAEYVNSKSPTHLRRKITELIQLELEALVQDLSITRSINSNGAVFYRYDS